MFVSIQQCIAINAVQTALSTDTLITALLFSLVKDALQTLCRRSAVALQSLCSRSKDPLVTQRPSWLYFGTSAELAELAEERTPSKYLCTSR